MRILLLIMFLCCGLNVSAQNLGQELPSEFIGNWFNPKTNEWNYGFFEKFAIINGNPALYKEIKQTKTGYKIVFAEQSNHQQIDLKILKTGISIAGVRYQKVNKYLPNYKGTDKILFIDTKFKSIDTAVIEGYLRNSKSSEPIAISVKNWLSGLTEQYTGDVDENGFFRVKIPLYNTSEVIIESERWSIIDVLEPGETYFLFKDLETDETLFYGANARVHNELIKYYAHKSQIIVKSPDDSQSQNKLTDAEFLNMKLANWKESKAADDEFILNHNLSDRVGYYITNKTKLIVGYELIKKSFRLEKGEKLSDEYYTTVKKTFLLESELQPWSLVEENYSFLEGMLFYQRQLMNLNTVRQVNIVVDLLDKGIIKGNNAFKNYMRKKAILPTINYPEEDQQYSSDVVSLEDEYRRVISEYKEMLSNYVDYTMRAGNSLKAMQEIFPNDLVELFHTAHIMSGYKNKPEAYSEIMLNDILQDVKSDFYRQIITNRNNDFVKIKDEKLDYENHLVNTDHLQNTEDASEILREILKPYKGKVVYMDFWGVWCAPCVKEMEHLPEIKKSFEGRDVVFLYLANNTSIQAWTNFIKSKKIEGKNIFHYNLPTRQQNLLEKSLDVNTFPSYILFDKEGNLVNKKAPWPSSLQRLVAEVEKLLQ